MATREENLKKLNEALEVMSNDELDQVAGGSYLQLSYDSKLLYEHGIMLKYYEEGETCFDYLNSSKRIDAGWSKAGITCVTKWGGSNLYFMKDTGKQISGNEARAYVRKNYKQVRSIYLDDY